MGLDRAPIEFQTFYFSHVLVVPPNNRGYNFPIRTNKKSLHFKARVIFQGSPLFLPFPAYVT